MEELSPLEGDSLQQLEQDLQLSTFTIFREVREYCTLETRLTTILEIKKKNLMKKHNHWAE